MRGAAEKVLLQTQGGKIPHTERSKQISANARDSKTRLLAQIPMTVSDGLKKETEMSTQNKTHYRKVFDSPYLSAADIVEPVLLTIASVIVETDKTKKTKDKMNTAYFVEQQIRPGEPLKPMILNATNSKMVAKITGSPFLEDWKDVQVEIYVDHNVRFGRETVEGLRIRPTPIRPKNKELTPENQKMWQSAIDAYKRDGGSLVNVEARVYISEENRRLLIQQATQS